MNHGTTFAVTADPNGDLTITNLDGSITVRKDGSIAISTLAPIELCGDSLGKLDNNATAGTSLAPDTQGFLNLLRTRGKKS